MTGFETRRVKVDQCINTCLLGGLASPRFVDQDSWMAWKIYSFVSLFFLFVLFGFHLGSTLV